MRILALDYGRKRIGTALTDPLGLTAQPGESLARGGPVLAAIADLVRRQEVAEIVLGYPRALSGEPSPMAKEVEAFAEKLKAHVAVPIRFWDERFTTSASERLLIGADVRREKRKEVRDSMAASLLLQDYLRSRQTP